MRYAIPIIAPIRDPISDRLNMDFILKFKKNNEELSLGNLYHIFNNSNNTNSLEESNVIKNDKYSAAGYYLTSYLRKNGYDTYLSNGTDEAELKELAKINPLAVCISSTLLLEKKSLQIIVNNIRLLFPKTIIIIGGMLVWKNRMYIDYIVEIANDSKLSKYIEDIKKAKGIIFPCNRSEIDADIFVISQHGADILLKILKRIEENSLNFEDIDNIATSNSKGDFVYHKQIVEHVDYDKVYTDWSLIDELPYEFPMRTSIGCPYRCKYCDFYSLSPHISLRSGESIKTELNIIKSVLKKDKNNERIIHLMDDNSFITEKRADLICQLLIETDTKLPWRGLIRSSSVTERNKKLILNSGLQQAQIGVETGSSIQLKRMHKNQTIEETKRGIEILDSIGVTNHLSLFIGFPGENEETINETIQFLNLLKISNSVYIVFPFIIIPFSVINSKESREEWEIEGIFSNWSHKTMNSTDARKNCYYLFKNVTNLSYSYRKENLIFNKKFPADNLKKIYKLRQNLTVQVIDKTNTTSNTYQILSEISKLMGFNNIILNNELINDIYCSVTF